MIIPDVNLLIYSYNADAPLHEKAKNWWERIITNDISIGIPWAVILGFIRLMTDNRVLITPLTPTETIRHIKSWLQFSNVSLLHPGPQHWDILNKLFKLIGVGGRMTTDTHIAALAIEYHAEIHSNDRDFGRFKGIRWKNPLISKN